MTMIAQATAQAFIDEIERGALTPSSAQDEILTLLGMVAATEACHASI